MTMEELNAEIESWQIRAGNEGYTPEIVSALYHLRQLRQDRRDNDEIARLEPKVVNFPRKRA